MIFTFQAKIYKVGINPCVKVPFEITGKMSPVKGYIPVRGKIKNHPFKQTLVPVKNTTYRLYVNGPMLKGSNTAVGEIVNFRIEQDFESRKKDVPMNKHFKKELVRNNLFETFEHLTPSRKKDILKYLNNLKTEESLQRNIDKVINGLRDKTLKTKYP